MHLLLIEPNILLADTYTQALRHAGFSITSVTGAQAAIMAADKQQPDLIILELYLPLHSGIEFLHEFRSYPEWQHVPIVVHSSLLPAKSVVAEEHLRRDLGVSEILYKPRTTLEQLLRVVRDKLTAA